MANGILSGHGNLSERGWANVSAVMPKIESAVEERSGRESQTIDLATAENWLIREEIIELCKESIDGKLSSKVRTVGPVDSLSSSPSIFEKLLPTNNTCSIFLTREGSLAIQTFWTHSLISSINTSTLVCQ